MGLRKKIFLGCIVIASVLLLSSVMAIYEFVVMRQNVTKLISANISSLNISNNLIEITDEYNFQLLRSMGDNIPADIPNIEEDSRFLDCLKDLLGNYSPIDDKMAVDSVRYAFAAYMHILDDATYVWVDNYSNKRKWYFEKLYPVYMKLREYIQDLNQVSQDALVKNYEELSNSFYRSIMPGVVAVCVGIILVFLFYYFANYYFISPMLAIIKGIQGFVQYKKSYTVDINSDDELKDLNDSIKQLVDTNKKLLKQTKYES
jgi:signal transduction histidine kinase